MCDKLRKVTFRLGEYEFHPDEDSAGQDSMIDYSKERIGYFHKWVEDVDTSKDIPYVRTMALVEDSIDGKIYQIESYNLNFSKIGD